MILLYALALYIAIGLVTGLAFVTVGIATVTPATVTVGARILLLPGATIFWPLIIARWRQARHAA